MYICASHVTRINHDLHWAEQMLNALRSFFSRNITPAVAAGIVAALVVSPTTSISAQASTGTAPQPLTVGSIAPDFTLTTVSAEGRTAKPFRLSEHRGKTVVLAFFPKARTAGCTVQMESYRDQFATLFRDGKDVVLIGVSTDADSSLIAWARDAKFPFLFGSDESRETGKAFGASNGAGFHKRHLYVINPRGEISYVATPFAQMAADAYTDLGKAVEAASTVR